MVDVSRGLVRENGNFVFAGKTNVENLGLRMVNPDDRVEVGRHVRVLVDPRSMTIGASSWLPCGFGMKSYRKCSPAG